MLVIFNFLKYFKHKLRLRNLSLAYLGENVQIFPGFEFGHPQKLELFSNTVIGINAHINAAGGVVIKSGTITGPDLMIYSVNHIFNQTESIPFSNCDEFKTVEIGENCWIGGRVFVAPGVKLGDGCIVAGGSVVTKSFPQCSVIGGNPAKLIKERDKKAYKEMCENGQYANFITRNIKKQ